MKLKKKTHFYCFNKRSLNYVKWKTKKIIPKATFEHAKKIKLASVYIQFAEPQDSVSPTSSTDQLKEVFFFFAVLVGKFTTSCVATTVIISKCLCTSKQCCLTALTKSEFTYSKQRPKCKRNQKKSFGDQFDKRYTGQILRCSKDKIKSQIQTESSQGSLSTKRKAVSGEKRHWRRFGKIRLKHSVV